MADQHGICLDCRTLLRRGEKCDGPAKSHRVVDIPERKDALVREVWGPATLRREAKRLARAGGTGAGLGSIFEGCGGCADCGGVGDLGGLGEILVVIVAILAVALVVVVLAWLVFKLVRYIRDKLERPKPFGALLEPAVLRGPHAEGVVQGNKDDSVARLLELRSKRAFGDGAIMLRDAQTEGFDVRLKTGATVRIPPGRIRIEAPLGKVDPSAGEARLVDIDPERVGEPVDPMTEPFPFDEVYVARIRPGDVVELHGELVPLASGGSAAYREPASIFVPTGVPALTLLSQRSLPERK